MKLQELTIAGLRIITPDVFSDERGFFLESYQQEKFAQNGIKANFVQDNHSFSKEGVLRGLHFQHPPYAQAKLLRVTRGKVFDVAVDLRPQSDTYGEYESVELSEENKKMFYIPPGFAHGFLALSEAVDFCYKVDSFYHPAAEGGLLWNDPALAIDWPEADYIISEKDQNWPRLKELKKINWV